MTRSRHQFQLALTLFLMVCAISFDYLSRIARAENAAIKRSNGNLTSIKDDSVRFAENLSQGIRDAVEMIRPSLVTIRALSKDSEALVLPPLLPEFSDGDYSPFNNHVQTQPSEPATGVIVSDDGYIWTSNDVVANLDSVRVTLQNNTSYEGKVVLHDPESGLGVIKVDAVKLPVAHFDSVTKPRLADWAVAVALNDQREPIISAGLISSFATERESQRSIERIRFAFPASAEFAGCAFVDLSGHLIGINAPSSSRIASESNSCTALATGSANEIHQKAVESAETKAQLTSQKSILDDSNVTQQSTQKRKEGTLSKNDTIGDLFSVPRSQWTSATIASSVRNWLTSRQDGKVPQKHPAANASESR